MSRENAVGIHLVDRRSKVAREGMIYPVVPGLLLGLVLVMIVLGLERSIARKRKQRTGIEGALAPESDRQSATPSIVFAFQ